MVKKNSFSDKFRNKPSYELIKIVPNKSFQKDARLAAIWELQNRGEGTLVFAEIEKQLISEIVEYRAQRAQLLKYHTFVPRLIAAFLDSIALGVFFFALSYLQFSNSFLVLSKQFLINLAPFIYSIAMHSKYGQTIGKMAMDVKVVDFNSEKPIEFKQAIYRDIVPFVIMIMAMLTNILAPYNQIQFLALLIGSISFFWNLLEIISMLFDDKARAIHDKIAGTVVIRTKS